MYDYYVARFLIALLLWFQCPVVGGLVDQGGDEASRCFPWLRLVLRISISALTLQGSHKPGKPGIVREFCKPGKVREFEIWSGNFL